MLLQYAVYRGAGHDAFECAFKMPVVQVCLGDDPFKNLNSVWLGGGDKGELKEAGIGFWDHLPQCVHADDAGRFGRRRRLELKSRNCRKRRSGRRQFEIIDVDLQISTS